MRRFIARVVLFSLSCLVFLELVFRFIIPACELPSTIQINPGGFLISDPGYQRSGFFTDGRIPSTRYHWVLNNMGYNSLFDFEPAGNRSRPLIAVIGDCTVENYWCGVEEHIDSWLHDILMGGFDIYAFGRGSQSLAQILLLMERIDSLYMPDLYVIVFSNTPLLGSILSDNSIEYSYVSLRDSTFLIREPSVRKPSEFARTVMRSAFVRYVRLNANVDLFPLMDITGVPYNFNAGLSMDSVRQLMPVVGDYLLGRMSHLLGERRLLIVVNDQERRLARYDSLSVKLNIVMDYEILRDLCAGFHNIDYLDPISEFRADFDTLGIRFESCDGRHLNGHGNYVMASAIVRRLRTSGTLDRILREWEGPGIR
jgi:hypothetical protein